MTLEESFIPSIQAFPEIQTVYATQVSQRLCNDGFVN